MKYSLRQLTMLMVNLLIVVTLASSAIGFHLLQDQYQTEESRHDAEARGRLSQVANGLASQLEFYQGILRILASRQSTADLLTFGDDSDAHQWSKRLRELIPGAFGAGIAGLDGTVMGDPLVQHIGDACRVDLKHFLTDHEFPYPPVHTNVPGLEHFDLMSTVDGDSGSRGALLISFRLESLTRFLEKALIDKRDALRLTNGDGQLIARAGKDPDSEVSRYSQKLPGTDWQVELITPSAPPSYLLRKLILFNLIIMAIVGLVVAAYMRRFANLLGKDMRALHRRIASVLEDDFDPMRDRPQISEIAAVLPDVDRLAQTIVEQKTALREQTLIDPLTGLHNRRHFDLVMKHVYDHSRRHTPAILLIMDLNKFKQINDTLGHQTGDRQLKLVAEQLRANTRASDQVARIGGDEFAVILQDIAYPAVDQWLRNLVERFDRELSGCRNSSLPEDACTLSIGVAAIDANHYASIDEVINSADLAMYRAKATGGSHSRFHKAVYHPHRVVVHRAAASTK
jgi:diguanylate cyclase (GGDEF)-like protein